MSVKIYVDNLSERVTERDLEKLFEQYGKVDSIELYKHHFGNKRRSFAYLDMPDDKEAMAAMKALYGQKFKGQNIKINQARTGPSDRRQTARGGGRRKKDPSIN
jgi:RNA recognition motif-containing protein